jgi:serine O-acetyltransferase
MINSIEKINRDQLRYASSFGKAFGNPCYRLIFWMRLATNHPKFHPLGLLGRFFHHLAQIRYGIQIPHITQIGAGFYIGHYGGIVTTHQAIIGENCNMAQGVTIGRINQGPRKGAPKIGNKVWIGPNAVGVGNISIGDNVLIAQLSLVNMDVPDN